MLRTSSCWRPLRVTLTRASVEEFRCGENLLGAILVVERRAIDGRDQVTRPQPDACERLAIGAWIDAEAAHLAAGEHRLGPQHLPYDAGIVADQLPHALQRGVIARGGRGRRRRR